MSLLLATHTITGTAAAKISPRLVREIITDRDALNYITLFDSNKLGIAMCLLH